MPDSHLAGSLIVRQDNKRDDAVGTTGGLEVGRELTCLAADERLTSVGAGGFGEEVPGILQRYV